MCSTQRTVSQRLAWLWVCTDLTPTPWSGTCSALGGIYDYIDLLAQVKSAKYLSARGYLKTTTISLVMDVLTCFGVDTLYILQALIKGPVEVFSLICRTTNTDGRCPGLINKEGFASGTYKLHFNTGQYWESLGQTSFYPYVEVTTCSVPYTKLWMWFNNGKHHFRSV